MDRKYPPGSRCPCGEVMPEGDFGCGAEDCPWDIEGDPMEAGDIGIRNAEDVIRALKVGYLMFSALEAYGEREG